MWFNAHTSASETHLLEPGSKTGKRRRRTGERPPARPVLQEAGAARSSVRVGEYRAKILLLACCYQEGQHCASVYSNNPRLGVSQKTNFGPRFGFAYQL